jgi:pseudouridine-5'-monophosphatase
MRKAKTHTTQPSPTSVTTNTTTQQRNNQQSKMMGKKALDAAQVLIDDLGLEGQLTAAEFVAQREKNLDALFPRSELMPGAERLVRHLAAHGVPMAVATSSHRRHFDVKTSKHGELFALMDHVVTGDQVANGKPHPEIFTTAAARFAAPPTEPGSVLVFEDAPVGVAAARAAGYHAVLVPDPNLDAALHAGASAVLPSLESFEPAEWGLPPF